MLIPLSRNRFSVPSQGLTAPPWTVLPYRCFGFDVKDSYGKILKSCQALITMAVPIVIVRSYVCGIIIYCN